MNIMDQILREISSVIKEVDQKEVNEAVRHIIAAKRIFVIGEGRSGLMAKAFAMRLMHLGCNSFVIGETITPSIAGDDILIAISGSGNTHHVVWTAKKAREQGVFVQALSTNADSELARNTDALIHVPAATKFRRTGEPESIQPLGSLFDQSAHIVFDAICLIYEQMQKIDMDVALKKHSNLEM